MNYDVHQLRRLLDKVLDVDRDTTRRIMSGRLEPFMAVGTLSTCTHLKEILNASILSGGYLPDNVLKSLADGCNYLGVDIADYLPEVDYLLVRSGTVSSKGGGEGCFIATAAYGSALSPEVDLLRGFRDEVLSQSAFGRAMIAGYYAISPPIARAIAGSRTARAVTRRLVLGPLIALLKRGAGADAGDQA